MESIIVLPALIIVFGLILFVNNGYTKAATAGTQTRGAGWTNTMASCATDSVASPTQKEDLGSWGISSLGGIASLATGIAGIVSDQPLVVSPVTAFTIGSFKINRRNYKQSATVNRARSIGGTARYGHRIALTCDENMDDLEMPGFSFGVWNFSAWNQMAWTRADL